MRKCLFILLASLIMLPLLGTLEDGDGLQSLQGESVVKGELADLQRENVALSFDGENDYVWGEGIPYSTGDMTLEAWIYPESFEDYQEIIFGIDPELSSTIQFRLNSDGSIIYGENPVWTNVLSRAHSVVLNEWNHIAVTREEGLCKLYTNGVEQEEGEVSQGVVPTNLYIGGRATGMDRMFDGKIDDVRIWNIARSEEELLSGMQTELTGTEYGLVGAWEFDEGEGQTVASITPEGYELTLGQTNGIDDSDPEWINTEEPYEIPICAYFGCNRNYGDVPLEVYFWDRSSGNPTQWSWDFNGDGVEDSNEQNPQWVYQIPGEYSILLTVSDGESTHTTIRESYMHVTGTAILPPENLQVSVDGLASWEAPSSGGFTEDFDSYTAGEYLVEQANGAWRTWDGSVGGTLDALVTMEQASNGANSVLIEGETDILHEIGVGGYTTGHYIVSMDVYVDDNYGAYFNVLHLWGDNPEWGAEVFLPSGDTGYLRAEGTEYYFNYSMEEWIEYSFDIDLDNDWAIFKMNGYEIHSWQWSLGCFTGNPGHNQLSAIDFYSNSGAGFTPRFFLDDVGISVMGNGVEPEAYNVYLDGLFMDSTAELSYQFSDLVSGTVHRAGVSAEYLQGESTIEEQMFTYGTIAGDKALEFDGINDHVFCGRDASLDLGETFTLEAWINPSGWGEYDQIGFGRILDKKRYKLFLVDDGSAVGYNDHSLSLGTHCDGQSYVVSTPVNSIELGEWQHISATYNMSGETHIYINGVEQILTGDLPVGALVSSSEYDLFIGEADNYGRAFAGKIEEVRIWEIERSQMEILSSMMQELSGTEEGLAGYWQFDEGSGQYTTDLTGNGNYGRLGSLAQVDEDDPVWIDSDFPFSQLTADFLANPQTGTAPLVVQFEDTSSGPITGWSWDFDNDGVIDSTDPDPEWTYAEAGVYSVSLTVSDTQSNSSTELKENYITVTPDWTINPPSYEYNGTIWGVVYHEEIMIDHTEGILGCFVGEECRGVASFEDGSVIDYTGIPQFGHVAFLPMLYSNETSGETVSFKYWDPYIGVYDLSETVEFTADMILGNGMDPFVWHTTTSVTVSKAFVNGWNWFSVNVLGDDMSINTILSSLGDSGNLIKNQTHSATYYSGMGWFGSLMELNNSCLYKLEANSSADLEVCGVPVNPAENPISLSFGWNWVSYIPQEAEETNYALSSLENGNIIKDQSHSATYYSGMGWYGSLMEMQPLSGYMLEMNEAEELIYPAPEVTLREGEEFSFEVKDAGWAINFHDYEFNEVVNVQLTGEANFDASGYELAVFCGEDCRGIAEIIDYTEPFGGIFHSMMVYSNEAAGEQLDFRLYNRRTGEVTDLENSIRFEADKMVGDFIDPMYLTVYGDEQAIPVTRLVSCYPNPFNPQTNISFELATEGEVKLEMYNVKGQKIDQIICDNLTAGEHVITWEASEQSSGIYFLKFTAGNTRTSQKLILLK